MKKKIITYGTFDLLHWGHINLLKRAKALGDFLIVAISTDEFNKLKHKSSYHSFEERKLIIEAIKYVDMVIAEDSWDQKVKDIIDYDVDTFVIGDDWKGEFDFLNKYCNVVYLERTEGISSSKIKEDLKQH